MLNKFKVIVENQIGEKIKQLRTDNDLEFYELEFNELCAT